MVNRRCDISSKEAVLPTNALMRRWAPPTRYTLRRNRTSRPTMKKANTKATNTGLMTIFACGNNKGNRLVTLANFETSKVRYFLIQYLFYFLYLNFGFILFWLLNVVKRFC